MKDSDVRSFIQIERRKLISYVRSLLNGAADLDAEDVVHDVFINVLERSDLPAPEYLAAYVFRALKNRVIDYARTRKPTVSLDAEVGEGSGKLADLLQDLKPGALESLQTREWKEELFRALEKLSEKERDVIIAHEFEGIPFRELSQARDIPLNTLLSHKSRAMKKLRKHFLDSQGDTL